MRIKFYEFLYYKIRPAEIASVIKKLLFIKRKIISFRGYRVDIDPVSYHGICLMKQGEYEEEMTQQIISILEKGDVFVDIGANEGYFSIVASRIVADSGRVMIVEPQKRCMSVIISNIEINGLQNCMLLPFGVSDKEGMAEMTLYPTTNTGASTMSGTFNFKTKFRFLRKMFWGRQNVVLKTIDNLLSGVDQIKLVKIDIEGFEMLAVNGARETLKAKKIQHLLIEVHPVALESMHTSVDSLVSLIKQFGYTEKKVAYNLYLFSVS